MQLLNVTTGSTVLLVLFLFGVDLSGQATGFTRSRDFNNGLFLNLGYHQSAFLNTRFASTVGTEGLKRAGLRYQAEVQLVKMPFVFNFAYFDNNFESDQLSGRFDPETKISHRGMELGASLVLLPDVKWLLPYAGVGYQRTAVQTWTDDDSSNVNDFSSSVPVRGLSAKGGAMIKFAPGFGLGAEYRRTLALNDNVRAYNQMSIYLTFSLSKLGEEVKERAR